MSRPILALLIGLVGIGAYALIVLALGDLIISWHWSLQLIYFALAGIIWVFPAKRLIYWGAGK